MKLTYLLFAGLLSNAIFAQQNDFPKWVKYQYQKSVGHLLNNISRPDTPKGFVIAAPSKSNPNYYYHWVRDAALVMETIRESFPYEKAAPMFRDYINLVDHFQQVDKLTGQGEVKFNPDGSSFKGPWGRPQNDGPALRVIAISQFAETLLKKGKEAYVRVKLYGGKIPAQTVLKRDLEYVSNHWKDHDFDLWEEVKGHHFFTRMAQRTALFRGAKLARKLGDGAAADFYEKQARALSVELEKHWNESLGYIITTRNFVDGHNYKSSNLDASVILAANHSGLSGLPFSILDDRIMATAEKLISTFRTLYPINNEGIGVAIGRYPEDRYFGGHPWFLLTAALGEYFYKVSEAIVKSKKIVVTKHNETLIRRVSGAELKVGTYKTKATVLKIAKKFREHGDNFLKRIQKHAGPNGQLDEQFDRHDGYMKSARHLTWSYAAFIAAANAR